MIRIVTHRKKNLFVLDIQNLSTCRKNRDLCSEIKGLYNAFSVAAETDNCVTFYKGRSNNSSARVEIKDGKYTLGAYRMVVEGLRALKKNYPNTIKLIERKD